MTSEDDSGLPAHVPVEDAAELLGWSVPLLAEAVREGRVICGAVVRENWIGTRVTVGVRNDSGSPDDDKLVVGRKDDYRPTGFWCLAPDDAYPIVRDGRGEVGTVVEWWHRLRKYRGASLHFQETILLERAQILVVRQTLAGLSAFPKPPHESARLPLARQDELAVGESPAEKKLTDKKPRVTERAEDHERWRTCAKKIQQERERDGKQPFNKCGLAWEVIRCLQLSDSHETVRKRI